jgi:hypothetical protein
MREQTREVKFLLWLAWRSCYNERCICVVACLNDCATVKSLGCIGRKRMRRALPGISILKRLLIVFVDIIEGKMMCYQLQLMGVYIFCEQC